MEESVGAVSDVRLEVGTNTRPGLQHECRRPG